MLPWSWMDFLIVWVISVIAAAFVGWELKKDIRDEDLIPIIQSLQADQYTQLQELVRELDRELERIDKELMELRKDIEFLKGRIL
ncbi:hypothetical protein [Archaeoglobus veneficus]|uniref:Uncharacterized protein n=1 Tax=Archaeoglobus veneficus (strain DSM 11195 / SNP6) TaxID=693661 RepID=F2KR53_ARCVS|nr:hypothetical protein [Archaeoglobus veneficus]AEA46690.1 hypothetical protein Arcve_0670 [Archaeoglobus veneficus SNP6]